MSEKRFGAFEGEVDSRLGAAHEGR